LPHARGLRRKHKAKSEEQGEFGASRSMPVSSDFSSNLLHNSNEPEKVISSKQMREIKHGIAEES
jgi:hypothetical protein